MGSFSITHSSILREHALARRLTPQWCAFETISVGGAKAMTRDFLLVLELYHLFCHIVGGVVSPILANLYLDKLDKFVEEVLIPHYTKGERRKPNPVYEKLMHRAHYLARKGRKEQAQALRKQAQQLPSIDSQDPDYRRLRYCRYADDVRHLTRS